MTEPEVRITIETSEDARRAPDRITESASAAGFDEKECAEIALVVRELALNVLQHGEGGVLSMREISDGERTGLEIEAVDRGRGIAEVEEAFRDGFSTRGSFGYGLGSVNRLMHSVEVRSPLDEGSGTRIRARRWRYTPSGRVELPFDVGLASRPLPGYRRNGDAFLLTSWDARTLVAVIDGMGHGEPAHRAARAAYTHVRRNAREPLETIFRGADRACRGTRGVVMALARFDWNEGTVSVGNIGNVEIRVFGSSEPMNFLVRRGFIGRSAPHPAVRTVVWPTGATMVLHTDGVRGTHLREAYLEVEQEPAQAVAGLLLRTAAREHDDATVAVIRRTHG